MEHIAAAGNTEVPAFLVLREAGFEVSTSMIGDSEHWMAKKNDLTLIAGSPLELLGLFNIRKERGRDWKASDVEIEAFLKEFPINEGRA
jgi:hypothetical protein